MSAVLRVPSLGFEHVFDDAAVALGKAQRIRDIHPGIDVLVDISAPAPSCGAEPPRPEDTIGSPPDPDGCPPGGDQLAIPDFLVEAARLRAQARTGAA